jgi:hypothetical protein
MFDGKKIRITTLAAHTPIKQHFTRKVVLILILMLIAGGLIGVLAVSLDKPSEANPQILASGIMQTNSTSPYSNTTALSAVSNGLQLSIVLTANKTTYAIGEDVEITFAITNVSNQTLNFINQNGDSNFNFQVYNSTNNAVYMWELGAYPLDNWNITLAPNESYTQNLIWTQSSNMRPSTTPLQQGAYYIIAELGYTNPYPIQTTPPSFQTAPLNITIINP